MVVVRYFKARVLSPVPALANLVLFDRNFAYLLLVSTYKDGSSMINVKGVRVLKEAHADSEHNIKKLMY